MEDVPRDFPDSELQAAPPAPQPSKRRKKTRTVAKPPSVNTHGASKPPPPHIPIEYSPFLHTPNKPRVYIRVVFLKIGEINTLKEQYQAEVFVQARWREPVLDGCQNVDDIDFSALWNPELHLENATNDPKISVWHDVSINQHGEAYVLEKRRVKADFCETLELHSFPFDVQHLSVLITSRLSHSSLSLKEDDQDTSSVNLMSFMDGQEWEVRDIVESIPEVRSREFSSIKHKFPIITVRTYVIRRAGYFVWNILAIMILICSLTLCTFSVSRDLPQNRLQLTFTLVLTVVAFKMVVCRSLPTISYLTVLDKYILGSLLLTHLVAVWHAVLTCLEDNVKILDQFAFAIFATIFCLYNLVFAISMAVKVYRKRKCVTDLEAEYKAKQMKTPEAKEGSTQIQDRAAKKNRHSSKVDTV